jgi:hypothetical protein
MNKPYKFTYYYSLFDSKYVLKYIFSKDNLKERYKTEYLYSLYNSILKVKKPHLFKRKKFSDSYVKSLIPIQKEKMFCIKDYEELQHAIDKLYESCPKNLISLVERKQKHLEKLLKAKKKTRSKKYDKKIDKISFYAGCLKREEPYLIVGG